MYSKLTSHSLPIIHVPKLHSLPPCDCFWCIKYCSSNISTCNLHLMVMGIWQICNELEYRVTREKPHKLFVKPTTSRHSKLRIDGIARYLGNLGVLNPLDSMFIIILPHLTVNNWVGCQRLVKYTGDNSQRRVGSFHWQVVDRCEKVEQDAEWLCHYNCRDHCPIRQPLFDCKCDYFDFCID